MFFGVNLYEMTDNLNLAYRLRELYRQNCRPIIQCGVEAELAPPCFKNSEIFTKVLVATLIIGKPTLTKGKSHRL